MPVSKTRKKKQKTSVVTKQHKAAEARQVRKNIKEIRAMLAEVESMETEYYKIAENNAEVH